MAKYQLYPKYSPDTYYSRDIFAVVCKTGDIRPVWAKTNSLTWGVDYQEFLDKCQTHCPCCGSKLDYGLGKNNHKKYDYETPSTDHLIPQSIGGTSDISNLWVICVRCNRMKNDATYNDIARLEGVLKILKETKPIDKST